MRKRKVTVILAIALLISLAGCGGTSGVDDVPPSNSIDASQTPAETPETPIEPTESTDPAQNPPKGEDPTEATQEPTTHPATSTPAPAETKPSTPTTVPTTEPTKPAEPVHTHSYTVTLSPTCTTEGIKTCSCGDTITIPANGHNYVTQTVEHTEERLIGTETVNDYAQVTLYGCYACDFTTYDSNEIVEHVDSPSSKCFCASWWIKNTTEVVGTHEEPKYATRTTSELVNVCSICGYQE